MNRILRSSTAIVASLALVTGHVPFAAMAQAVDQSQCAEGEDEADCLARLVEDGTSADEATPDAPPATDDPATQDPPTQAAEEAPEDAAEAEVVTDTLVTAEEVGDIDAEPVDAAEASESAETVETPTEESAAPSTDVPASTEGTDGAADGTAPEAEAEAASPASEEESVTTIEDAEALSDALAAEMEEPAADAEVASPASEEEFVTTIEDSEALSDALAVETEEPAADAEPAAQAAQADETVEAEVSAGTDGEAATTVAMDADALSAEDRAALQTAQETAAAAELEADLADPVAEAEAEIAATETDASQALQSLALQSDAAPIAGSTEEVVTEENVRRSDEDFQQLLSEGTEATEASDRDRSGLTGAQGLILGGIAGLAIGSIIAGNRQVVNRADDRLVVLRPEGDYQVIRDDDTLLRRPGNTIFTDTFEDGSSRNVVTQPDGTQIITVRDRDLRILRRTVVAPDGTRTILIDDIAVQTPVVVSELPQVRQDEALTPVDPLGDAAALARALEARTMTDRGFSLSQIRSIRAVRNLAPALNLESVTFETSSAAITPDQAQQLLELGVFMTSAIDENPREIFLIEGHTDATGSASLNLGLSDRRAETVALALTEFFGVPAQNMVIQGYGEEFLLIPTLENERQNRRVAVRRITDLLRVAAAE